MGTTGSVDGAGRLVIKGRFQQKQVENVLRRYIGENPFIPTLNSVRADENLSRIRDVQNLQIARHTLDKRKSYLLHGLRVLWK
jgi:translation initiation factor 2 beta subunit (eIF-2beta)/eIF-5